MAMIRILYFARLRETLGSASEDLELPAASMTIAELMALLAKRGEIWQEEFDGRRSLRAAVNQSLAATNSAEIRAGDEVAFFPPVTGG